MLITSQQLLDVLYVKDLHGGDFVSTSVVRGDRWAKLSRSSSFNGEFNKVWIAEKPKKPFAFLFWVLISSMTCMLSKGWGICHTSLLRHECQGQVQRVREPGVELLRPVATCGVSDANTQRHGKLRRPLGPTRRHMDEVIWGLEEQVDCHGGLIKDSVMINIDQSCHLIDKLSSRATTCGLIYIVWSGWHILVPLASVCVNYKGCTMHSSVRQNTRTKYI